MSGANARRVRVEFPDKRGGSPSTLTQPSPSGRRIYWFQASPFQFIEPYPSEMVQGMPVPTAFQQTPLSYLWGRHKGLYVLTRPMRAGLLNDFP